MGFDGTRRRLLIPDLKTLGGIRHYSHLAVTSGTIAVASELKSIAWRPLNSKPGGKVLFQRQDVPMTLDFDLSGDRVLLMGLANYKRSKDGAPPRFSPQGDVAWISTLSSRMEDRKPVLYDIGGPGAPNYFNCGSYQVGALRFFGNGSFVIAPGFQDGVSLFSANGRREHTWTSAQIGVDSQSGCATMTEDEETKFRTDDSFLQRWVNTHHLIDDILALPQGPGVLVRSWGEDGAAHWTLQVLRPEGVQSYAVPIVGRRAFDRLHGDVRNGRILLLLSHSGYPYSKAPADLSAELFLMELPNAREEN